eukprot:12937400-Prorocentrum_lima.AAC.1
MPTQDFEHYVAIKSTVLHHLARPEVYDKDSPQHGQDLGVATTYGPHVPRAKIQYPVLIGPHKRMLMG